MSDYSEDTRNSLGITFGDKTKKSRNSLHGEVSWDCFTSSSQKEELNRRSIPTDVNYTALQRVLKNRNQTKLERYAGSKQRIKVLEFTKNETQQESLQQDNLKNNGSTIEDNSIHEISLSSLAIKIPEDKPITRNNILLGFHHKSQDYTTGKLKKLSH